MPADAGLLTLRLQDEAGEWRYLEAGISDLRGDADVAAVVLHCRDMTERHAREQALQSVAYTDPMTGLPNRAGFLRHVRAVAAAADQPTTLLVIELDGLAAARENAGREVVSAVVAEIGRRLRATVRGEDVVARMGGGAFAVLAEGTDADADRLAARCLSVVEQPILTTAGVIELTSGVGLVPLEEGLGVEALLARGDLAVRAAHEAGLGSARRYHDGLGDAAARRDRLRHDLQGARARGELFLLFQPIVSLEQQRITGMEAQLRWKHAELGEVPPEEFLALAERAGLIGELMRWAVEETACAVARAARARGPAARRPEDPLRLPRDRAPRQRRRAGPGAVRPGAGAAGPADQRARCHVGGRADRPRCREPAAHGRARGARRLRERLLGAGAPDPVADRHPPARSLADQPDRPRPAEPGAVRVDRRHRPRARARRRGRRRGDAGTAGRAVRLRLRVRPGLPDLPSAAARRVPRDSWPTAPACSGRGWSGPDDRQPPGLRPGRRPWAVLGACALAAAAAPVRPSAEWNGLDRPRGARRGHARRRRRGAAAQPTGSTRSSTATWRGFAAIAGLLALGHLVRAFADVGVNPAAAGPVRPAPGGDRSGRHDDLRAPGALDRRPDPRADRARRRRGVGRARRAARDARPAHGRRRRSGPASLLLTVGYPAISARAVRRGPGHLRRRLRAATGGRRLAAADVRLARGGHDQRRARGRPALTRPRRGRDHRLPGDAGRRDPGAVGRSRARGPGSTSRRRGAARRRRRQLLPGLRRPAAPPGQSGGRPAARARSRRPPSRG